MLLCEEYLWFMGLITGDTCSLLCALLLTSILILSPSACDGRPRSCKHLKARRKTLALPTYSKATG
jgi:hypothetical protein